jgi:hypothetical protein
MDINYNDPREQGILCEYIREGWERATPEAVREGLKYFGGTSFEERAAEALRLFEDFVATERVYMKRHKYAKEALEKLQEAVDNQ